MCVIMVKEPGTTIPFDKLEIACDINKHGYGISRVKNKRLVVTRKVSEKNDPKELRDLLDPLKDQRVYIHLRHATVGDISIQNSHPFIVMGTKDHGVDLHMMHNGTIWDFKPTEKDDKRSDSLLFMHKVVRPLAERSRAFLGSDKILRDDIFMLSMDKFVPCLSVMVFMDSFGNELIINKKQGKQFDGWWASNDYSFQANHFRSSAYQAPSYGRKTYDGYAAWEKELDEDKDPWFKEVKHETSSVLPFPDFFKNGDDAVRSATKNYKHQQYQLEQFGHKIRCGSKKENTIMTLLQAGTLESLEVTREKFIEQCGIENLDQLGNLTVEDLEEYCDNYPHAAAQAIVELLYERHAKKDVKP